MKNTTHRVVILNNVNSDIISQAILILKNSEVVCEDNVLQEAERIVERYMCGAKAKQKNKKLLYALLTGLAMSFIGVLAFLIRWEILWQQKKPSWKYQLGF